MSDVTVSALTVSPERCVMSEKLSRFPLDPPEEIPDEVSRATRSGSDRITVHDEVSLQDRYALDDRSRELFGRGIRSVVVVDRPTFVGVVTPHGLLAHGSSNPELSAALVQTLRSRLPEALGGRRGALAERAMRLRRGHHVYPHCYELSPLEFSVHANHAVLLLLLLLLLLLHHNILHHIMS